MTNFIPVPDADRTLSVSADLKYLGKPETVEVTIHIGPGVLTRDMIFYVGTDLVIELSADDAWRLAGHLVVAAEESEDSTGTYGS